MHSEIGIDWRVVCHALLLFVGGGNVLSLMGSTGLSFSRETRLSSRTGKSEKKTPIFTSNHYALLPALKGDGNSMPSTSKNCPR